MIIKLIIILITLKYLSGQNATCNDKYCLYYGGTVDGPNSHEEARTLCSQNNSNGWLLEVYDEEVSQLVDKFVEGHKNNLESILLNTKIFYGEWKWINNKTFANPNLIMEDYKDGIVSAIFLVNNLTIYTSHYLNDSNKVPMCQIEDSSKCEATKSFKYKDSCYFQLRVVSTWFEGQNECHKVGGRLAVFDDVDFNNVDEKWFDQGHGIYWVGLTRYLVVWSKGCTSLIFNKWKDDFPQNNVTENQCITINSKDDNTWINLKCGQTFSVVCMRDNNDPKKSADKSEDLPKSADKSDDPKKSADKSDDPKKSADKSDDSKKSADKSDDSKKSADKSDDTKKSVDKSENPKKSADKSDDPKKSADEPEAAESNSPEIGKSWIAMYGGLLFIILFKL